MILYLVQRGTFSVYNQSIDSDFLRCHYFFCDSRTSKVQYRIASSGNGKYMGLGLNGAERITIIVDICNIIQKVRDTGIRLLSSV